MERKKKLRITQIFLLISGILIIFFTYYDREIFEQDEIISKETQEKIKRQSADKTNGDVFFNIEYSGLDLAGNRYILKSEEAFNNKINQEIVNMKSVRAVFYFKDDTILNVNSDFGTYNNKTLDMNFNGNVTANYEGSSLFAEEAEYSNSQSFLKISKNVKINDFRGTMAADNLFFDLKKQTLNIASFNDSKINANIDLKWKKVLEF